MGIRIITNNEVVYEKYKSILPIKYLRNYSYLEVLKYTRDKIHLGHQLYTHPLSGNTKPTETPYKSIVISQEADDIDEFSLNVIERSILDTINLLNTNSTLPWTKEILDNCMIIDLSVIENSIN